MHLKKKGDVMKVCPVCQGKVFDDMHTCYNCLHRFEEQEAQKYEEPISESEVYSPQWVMPKEESSLFRDYLSKYSQFLTGYLKSC